MTWYPFQMLVGYMGMASKLLPKAEKAMFSSRASQNMLHSASSTWAGMK